MALKSSILIKVSRSQNLPQNFPENFPKNHQGPQDLWLGPKRLTNGDCSSPQELEKAREAGYFLVCYITKKITWNVTEFLMFWKRTVGENGLAFNM